MTTALQPQSFVALQGMIKSPFLKKTERARQQCLATIQRAIEKYGEVIVQAAKEEQHGAETIGEFVPVEPLAPTA